MTRVYKVLDEPKIKDSRFTGEPMAAATRAGSQILGRFASGTKTVTVKIQDLHTDKIYKYKVTKTKLKDPREISYKQADGTTKDIKIEYDTKAVSMQK